MKKKLLFIFNPNSGKAQIKNSLCEILTIFTKGGYDVTAHPAIGASDTYETIKNDAKNYDLIVVSGGDGTLDQSVKGMMTYAKDKRRKIGYIPSGTVNDFASNLGVSTDMTEAAKLILTGCDMCCDIGDFNGEVFDYVAAFGAFTDVSYDTPQASKNLLGNTAYLIEGLKRIPNLKSTHVRLTYDGDFIEGDYLIGMVLNSTHIAGMEIKDSFDIQLNDGVFEVVLIAQPENIMKLGSIFTAIRSGSTSGDGFTIVRASKMHFEFDNDTKWTLDGEYGGCCSEADIFIHRCAVTFISSHEKKALNTVEE